MKTSADLRAAAARCRRLSESMGNPDDVQTLLTLATEFDELIEAVDAVDLSVGPDETP